MVRFDFAYDGGGEGKGGTGTLLINGKKLGEDWGTPVSPDYKLPAEFTGDLKRLTIEVREH